MLHHPGNHRKQLLTVDRLGDPPADLLADRVDEEVGVGIRTQDNDRHLRIDLADRLDHLDAVKPRHSDVGNDQGGGVFHVEP